MRLEVADHVHRVVDHQRHRTLAADGREAFFIADGLFGHGAAQRWAVRTSGDPMAIAQQARALVHELKYGGWPGLAGPMAERMARLQWPDDVVRAPGADELAFLDAPSRTVGWGPTFHPTGDVSADMDVLREFYAAPPPGGGSRGDHYVTLKVVLPDPPDADLTRVVEDWGPKHPYPVR